MKPFLRKHGRFAAVLVVMMTILFIADGEFTGLKETIDQRRNQARSLFRSNYRALFNDAVQFNGEPATVQGRRIQDRTQAITQVAQARAERLAFDTAPDYTLSVLPADASPDDQFARIFQRRDNDLRRELGFQRYFGPDVSSSKAFGFERPDGSRTYNSAEIAGFLRKLDIMRTVARSVERNRVARLTSLEFVVINDALFSRGVPARGALADEQPYLSGEGLVVRLRATEEALYSFLVDMQRPEKDGLRQRYLSVEKFKLEKPDLLNPSDNLIDATITLVAWRVNEDSSFPADKDAQQQQQQATNQPRRFR